MMRAVLALVNVILLCGCVGLAMYKIEQQARLMNEQRALVDRMRVEMDEQRMLLDACVTKLPVP